MTPRPSPPHPSHAFITSCFFIPLLHSSFYFIPSLLLLLPSLRLPTFFHFSFFLHSLLPTVTFCFLPAHSSLLFSFTVFTLACFRFSLSSFKFVPHSYSYIPSSSSFNFLLRFIFSSFPPFPSFSFVFLFTSYSFNFLCSFSLFFFFRLSSPNLFFFLQRHLFSLTLLICLHGFILIFFPSFA